MSAIIIIILILNICLLSYNFYKLKHQKQIDNTIEQKNKELLEDKLNLYNEIKILQTEKNEQTEALNELTTLINNMNKNTQLAYSQYVDTLETSYNQHEQEYENSIELLTKSYNAVQDNYLSKIENIKQDLEKISATRAAAIKAQNKEKEIKMAKTFYSVSLLDNELKDVKILKDIEYKLSNPRILKMLIWSTYYRDKFTTLCNNVLGIKIITGIYKITNQLNDMCYIGQSVDIAKRWKDHAKCGLGIDTPNNNKLYEAMQQDGLENFTFELLEECKQNDLNEKEKFYIELYQAKEFGYNSKGGIG